MGISVKGVGKVLGSPPNRILTGLSFDVKDGEFVALTGRSGSGKSTLLYLLGSLDKVSEGTIEIDGRDLSRMKSDEINLFRNQDVGFVFQFHYLLAELTALENVLMPARKANCLNKRRAYAERLLNGFGLFDKKDRLPRELSGGEQQRLAISRALVMEPKYLFADEPTGSLDSINGEKVMEIIRESNKRLKTTVILVTHDKDFARSAHRQIHLVDGKIV